MSKIKVLFLAANPIDTVRLSLDKEIREIKYKIRISEGRDLIDLISAFAVTPDDLLQFLNQYKPHIVHFSGHGSEAGEITLMDHNGNSKHVSSTALRSLFSILKHDIKVVLLNACYSFVQGTAINESIDFVVGMTKAITDEAAITFSASFYRALGFGCTIKDAFEQGKTALLLEGIPEDRTPQLLVKDGADLNYKLELKPGNQPPSTGVGGSVKGGNIVIGGQQVIHGNLTINDNENT